MLERSRQASTKEALNLLHKSLEMAGQTPLTLAERTDLAGQFMKSLSHHKFTMDQIEKVLAGKAKRRIARQIYYQRYLEQWHVEHPLPFRLVWDCPKGQEPAYRSGTVTTTP